jgi:predicted dienelactone hydrolase
MKNAFFQFCDTRFKSQAASIKNTNKKDRFHVFILTILLAIAVSMFVTPPLHAAEQIFLSYAPFRFAVSVQAIETFAQEGRVENGLGQLGRYINHLTPERQNQVRTLLRSRFEVDPIRISKVLNTASGGRILNYFGKLIKTESGQNGFYDIRAAMVMASFDTKGLSVINFLHQLPTNIQLNIKQVRGVVRQITTLFQQTGAFMTKLEQQANALAASEPAIDFSQLSDLRQAGKFGTSMKVIDLQDSTRDRKFAVDFYLPIETNQSQIPVIIISNGLGSKPDRFTELAKHLASHGYAVAVPDHPGSSNRRNQDFFAGLYSLEQENFDFTEFVDRPLDITYLLNELERRNPLEFKNQLNLEQVGIFGYSFGGTTALILAGGKLDFDQLANDCGDQLNLLNISVVYQCRALELPRQLPDLQDSRIKAAFVFVPFSNSLFGKTGISRISVPVFWEATDEDVVTPLMLEQIPAFARLTAPKQYLAVSKGLPHTRVTLGLVNRLTNRQISLEEVLRVTQDYLSALSLGFFNVYVAQNDSFRPYLTATYAQALTETPYQLSLVNSLSPDQ